MSANFDGLKEWVGLGETMLSTVVVVSAGVMAYALSGGEEEFPTTLQQQSEGDGTGVDINADSNKTGNNSENPSFNVADEQSELMMDRLDEILAEFNKQSTIVNAGFVAVSNKVDSLYIDPDPPVWAKQVSQALASGGDQGFSVCG
jgi:hypothetical protein